ncbi:MAG: hypothetical protein COW10_06950, partial [Candidatus Omnitrophica bacterium CG12_big_fil_rev_8_21_14_0_65_42_8]
VTNILYNGFGQQKQYNEITQQDDLNLATDLNNDGNIDDADLRVDTSREAIFYDKLGQMVKYFDTAISNEALAVTTETKYDVAKVAPAGTDYKYNTLGQVVEYTQTTKRIENGNEIITTITRKNIDYNVLGQLKYYEEDATSNITGGDTGEHLITKTTWEAFFADSYNMAGQLAHYKQSARKIGYDASGVSIILDVTTDTERVVSSFNALGQVAGYTERTAEKDSTNPAVYLKDSTTVRTNTLYNTLGQMEYYHDSIINNTGATDLKTDIYFGDDDANGLTVAERLDPNVVHTVYDVNSGRLTSYTEYKVETDISTAGGVLDVATTTARQAMTYNVAGQLYSYDETVAKGGTATINTNRKNTTYLTLGMADTYEETVNSDATTGLTTTVNFDATEYDLYARLRSYSETRHDVGIGLDVTTVTTRSKIDYNPAGQTIRYEEQVDKNGELTSVIRTIDSNTGYNLLGQLDKYKDVKTQKSQISNVNTVDYQTTVNRTKTNYDLYGRIKLYEENAQLGIAITYSKVVIDSSVDPATGYYNATGQIKGQIEYSKLNSLVSESNFDTRVKRVLMNYNDLGQLTSYKDTKTSYSQTSTGSVSFNTIVTRTATIYNSDNMVSEYKENSTLGSATTHSWVKIDEYYAT